MADLTDQTALVTGASTGIGAAAAVALAGAGCNVAVHYYRSESAAKKVARTIQQMGREATINKADITDPDQVRDMVRRFVKTFGRIDILFANAGGLIKRSSIAKMPDRLWHQVIALNLDSVFYTVRAALGPMRKRKRGNVIVNASVAARSGGGGNSVHYATAKGALVTFVKGLAKEVAAEGIRVNAVAPGVTLTPFHDKATKPARMKRFKASIPIGKFGEVDDVARAVVWLAGETDGFITGETIYIAGGGV